MYQLDCSVQKYDWGRTGHQSKVATYKSAQDNTFRVNENEAYAELWMGTHSRGPSKIIKSSNEKTDLSSYLKEKNNLAIGERISSHFYSNSDGLMNHGDLPFLFKVLSINKALSIQAHPNKQLAKQLHANDPKNYPDANHKPEMLVAISDKFEAMCGFRVASEIVKNFQSYKELHALCGDENCHKFVQIFETEANNMKSLESTLAECLRSLMNQNEQFIEKQFKSLSTFLSNKNASDLSDLESLFLRLAKQYPNDVGCFVVFLLNCFSLDKGEAINLAANIPHAYLFGDGVECMACSDNVVRAGLTPKFKDVETLCSMLDYSMRSASENKLASVRTKLSQDKPYLCEFRPVVDEFSIQQIRIKKEHLVDDKDTFLIPKCDSGSILIVIETTDDSCFEIGNTKEIVGAKIGLVYFIDANTDIHFKLKDLKATGLGNNVLLAYRAYCDIKS